MANDADMKARGNALEALLKQAAAARASEDTAKIVAAQKALRKFEQDSPDEASALAMQARLAICDLDLDSTDQAVESIRARAAEVSRIAGNIESVSAAAKQDAAVLGGTLALQAIDAATSAISSFTKLRAELSADKPDEQQIATEIDRTIAMMQGLRGKLEQG
jgi:hypothetical protein